MGGYSYHSSDVEDFYDSHNYGGSFRSDSGKQFVGKATSNRDVSEMFESKSLSDKLNPAKIKLPRTSHDSVGCPNSWPFIFCLDTTGSNYRKAMKVIQTIFPEVMIQVKKSAPDVQIMVASVLDVHAGDPAPLQVTQFEADTSIIEQFKEFYLPEYCGGGNGYESYSLIWYFAAKYIETHSFEKRGRKGILVTLGDEGPTPYLYPDELREVFGDREDLSKQSLSDVDLLEMVSEKWDVYHIILHGSGYYEYSGIPGKWKKLMGYKAMDLSEEDYIPDLVSAIFGMHAGKTKNEVLEEITDTHIRSIVKNAMCDFPDTIKSEAKATTLVDEIETF